MGIKDEIQRSIKGQEVLIESMTIAIRNRRSMIGPRGGRMDDRTITQLRVKMTEAKGLLKSLKKEMAAVNRNAVMLSVLDKIVLRIDELEDRIDNLRIEV